MVYLFHPQNEVTEQEETPQQVINFLLDQTLLHSESKVTHQPMILLFCAIYKLSAPLLQTSLLPFPTGFFCVHGAHIKEDFSEFVL